MLCDRPGRRRDPLGQEHHGRGCPRRTTAGFIALHGYASGTPATDGKAVYAFFGRSGVLAYSLDGELLWRAGVGDGTHGWGSAASPILFEDLVIVNASVESQSIVALDKADRQGSLAGRGDRASRGARRWWSTCPTATQELVVSMKDKVLGLDPATGKQLWECAGVKDYVCPAVIAHEGDRLRHRRAQAPDGARSAPAAGAT